MLGIFGHGNVAGIGEALVENLDFPYILNRNEQNAVHMAAGSVTTGSKYFVSTPPHVGYRASTCASDANTGC